MGGIARAWGPGGPGVGGATGGGGRASCEVVRIVLDCPRCGEGCKGQGARFRSVSFGIQSPALGADAEKVLDGVSKAVFCFCCRIVLGPPRTR